MVVGPIDSLLLETEAEVEAEAYLWTQHTTHIAAHTPGPTAPRKGAREGPVGLQLTRHTGPVLTQAPLVESSGDPDFEDAGRRLMSLMSLI